MDVNIRDVHSLSLTFRKARGLFDSDDATLAYMEDRGLDVERATLLEHLGRFMEAGQIMLNEEKLLQAIDLFLKEHDSVETAKRVSQCLLYGLRQRLSLGIDLTSPAVQEDEVLAGLTCILNSSETKAYDLDPRTHDEVGPQCMPRMLGG